MPPASLSIHSIRPGSGFTMKKCLLVLCLLGTTPVFAGPFSVSSPDVSRTSKIKLGSELKDAPDKKTLTLPKIKYETPLAEQAGITLELPCKMVDRKAGKTDRGIADMAVKVKWNFHTAGNLRLATKPKLALPTGDRKKGLGKGEPALKLPLIMGYKAGHWDLIGEVGYEYVFNDDKKSAYLGMLIIHSLSSRLKVGAELINESPDTKWKHTDTQGNIGLKWKASSRYTLEVLAGRALHSQKPGHSKKYKLSVSRKL